MPFQMHRLFITILIIQKRRCGDSDLTPGLTGSSVGSLATRESAPQPPPASSILLLNPLPLLLQLLFVFDQARLPLLERLRCCVLLSLFCGLPVWRVPFRSPFLCSPSGIAVARSSSKRRCITGCFSSMLRRKFAFVTRSALVSSMEAA